MLTGGVFLHAIRDHDDESGRWRIADGVAIREYRYATEMVPPPQTVRAYGSCDRCAPILARTNGRGYFGIVDSTGSTSTSISYCARMRPRRLTPPVS